MAASDQQRLEKILQNLGMEHLYSKCLEEKIDIDSISYLTDKDLSRLGISTIGDRVRLREACRATETSPSSFDNHRGGTSGSASNFRGSRALEVRNERSVLFSPGVTPRGHSKNRNANKRKHPTSSKVRSRPWTAQFVCLASRFQLKVPNANEKSYLLKAGLGFKKIKLDLDDDEGIVYEKLSSDEKNDLGDTFGFPKLKEAGGFELMTCVANCRDLSLLSCSMSAQDIKNAIGGGQTKIYVRPIQNSLSTTPLVPHKSIISTLKQKCKVCGVEVALNELRNHFRSCANEDLYFSENDLEDIEDEVLDQSPFSHSVNTNFESLNANSESVIANSERPRSEDENDESTVNVDNPVPTSDNASSHVLDSVTLVDKAVNFEEIINNIVVNCKEKKVDQNPTEILRYMQKSLITGRDLEVKDPTICVSGETNFILVDRDNLLVTGFEEISSIKDLFITLEVQFYDEVYIIFAMFYFDFSILFEIACLF